MCKVCDSKCIRHSSDTPPTTLDTLPQKNAKHEAKVKWSEHDGIFAQMSRSTGFSYMYMLGQHRTHTHSLDLTGVLYVCVVGVLRENSIDMNTNALLWVCAALWLCDWLSSRRCFCRYLGWTKIDRKSRFGGRRPKQIGQIASAISPIKYAFSARADAIFAFCA